MLFFFEICAVNPTFTSGVRERVVHLFYFSRRGTNRGSGGYFNICNRFFFHLCYTFSIHTYNYYEIFCYLLFLNRNRNLKE